MSKRIGKAFTKRKLSLKLKANSNTAHFEANRVFIKKASNWICVTSATNAHVLIFGLDNSHLYDVQIPQQDDPTSKL